MRIWSFRCDHYRPTERIGKHNENRKEQNNRLNQISTKYKEIIEKRLKKNK